MAEITPRLLLVKPTVNGPETDNVWGFDVNDNFDKLDVFAGSVFDGEIIDDRVAQLLVEGPNITLTYNDAAGSLTIGAASGAAGIPEAPTDGTLYGRQSSAWAPVVIPPAGISDAPSDGTLYGRLSGAWSPVVIPPPGIGEAPVDGQIYARQSATWIDIPGIGGITPTEYTYATTAGLPPSSGQLRVNSLPQNTVTNLYLHKVNALTVDVANALRLIQIGNVLLIQDKTNAANYQYYTVRAAIVEAATYFTIPVTWLSGGAAFTAGRVMVAAFGMGSTPFPEAPTDGQLYYRRGSTGSWVKATISTSAPSGGVDGDIWYQYV